MMSHVPQFLVFGCGVLLALPPGWCCFVMPAAGQVRQDEPAPAPCECCCKTAPAKPELPPPQPVDPNRCPVCGDRDLVKPAPVEPPSDDLASLAASVPVIDVGVPALSLAGAAVTVGDLTRPLHVLHCVWTC